ncbi:hypothetical protein J4E93_006078 [Alternaria ventricosa]|uniref:uncharacterized protein n=1 Tax=Alternaria ventricosa TaxID=1187951 RepID=UPI0020C3D546|nr:uncharacterized protein J4E93_006078 [Alternaria ventricosa]KAI4645278.1 hypothetical protein J4E93_006078 [Alternaria ventricosa]
MASHRTDIGREDKFLSEHELYEFRFLTSVLSWTNNIDKSAGHTRVNNPASRHAPLYRFTADLADLLVRHLEIVAVTASDEKNLLAVYDNSGDAELDPQEDEEVNVTQNLQDFNRGAESGDKGEHPPVKINSTSTATTSADAPSTSAGRWLLRVTLAHPVAQKFPKTNVTFGTHFTNIVKLAQATYTAGDKKAARTLLNNYILLSSSAKIMVRIRKGMPKARNLYEFLTKPGSDLMHGLRKTELDFSIILRIVASEDTLGKTLTQREQSVIKETMQLLKVKSEANLGVLTNYDAKVVVKTKTLYEPMSKIADELAINEAMSYNEQTAEFLQSMLSAVLINVKGSFKALTFAKRQAQLYKAGNYDLALANDPVVSQYIQDSGHSLDKLATEAGLWLHVLTVCKQVLREYLKANLRLIRVVYALKNVRRLKVLDKQKHQMVDPEVADLDSISAKKQWEDAAMAWIDLICLYQTAFMSLSCAEEPTQRNKGYELYLFAANFRYLEASTSQMDKRLFFTKYLKEFEKCPGELLTNAEVQTIRQWLLTDGHGFGSGVTSKFENPTLEMKNFSGTYHCETTLICLYLLGRKRDYFVDKDADADLPENLHHYLRLPPKSITDTMRKAMDVLPVSKRCCPACHALVRYLVTYHKCNLMYAGNHAVWFAAALPPWIPKPAGLYVLAEARRALGLRVQKILKGETVPPGSDDSWRTDETSHHFSTSLPQPGAYSSPRLPTVVEGWIYPSSKARAKCYDCDGRIAGIYSR